MQGKCNFQQQNKGLFISLHQFNKSLDMRGFHIHNATLAIYTKYPQRTVSLSIYQLLGYFINHVLPRMQEEPDGERQLNFKSDGPIKIQMHFSESKRSTHGENWHQSQHF